MAKLCAAPCPSGGRSGSRPSPILAFGETGPAAAGRAKTAKAALPAAAAAAAATGAAAAKKKKAKGAGGAAVVVDASVVREPGGAALRRGARNRQAPEQGAWCGSRERGPRRPPVLGSCGAPAAARGRKGAPHPSRKARRSGDGAPAVNVPRAGAYANRPTTTPSREPPSREGPPLGRAAGALADPRWWARPAEARGALRGGTRWRR